MRRFLALILLAVPSAAMGQSAPPAQGAAAPDCYCTDGTGGRVELGQEVCLFVDGRAFMARCEMALNNPMWRPTGEACISSRLIERLLPVQDAGAVDPKV